MKNYSFKTARSFIALAILSLIIPACADEPSEIESGIFADAQVSGLMYESGNIVGRTDENGTFYYSGTGPVTFSIKGAVIGRSEPKSIITPVDLISYDLTNNGLVDDSFVTHPNVLNMSIFLQSIDEDAAPDNGIAISESVRNSFNAAFSSITSLDFSDVGFASITTNLRSTFSLVSTSRAQEHLFNTIAEQKNLMVDIINLGDGFTAGTQSTRVALPDLSSTKNINIHKYSQLNGYARLIASQLLAASNDANEWNSPLLDIDSSRVKTLMVNLSTTIPNNLAVHGATTKSLINEQTSTGNSLLDEIMQPILNNWTALASVSQLDSAKKVAERDGHENRMKLFTLWAGMNDIVGALTDGGGSNITDASINSFLSDSLNGHDLTSVMGNLSGIVNDLKSIDYSYVFIGNMPDPTLFGSFFYRQDIEYLAAFDNVSASALVNYSTDYSNLGAGESDDKIAISFAAFAGYSGSPDVFAAYSGAPATNIARFMNSTGLNSAIAAVPDQFSLTKGEAKLIKF